MNGIKFKVPSIPVAQPRQRTAVRAGRAVNYTPTKHPVNQFKAAVQMAAAEAYQGPPLEGPVGLAAVFVMNRVGKLKKRGGNPTHYAAKKPDIDNLMKALSDAMNTLVYRDDSQICELILTKRVASGEEQPHVDVSVYQLSNADLENRMEKS